jgi:dolichol-phosphate mannosyltransferase
MTPHQGFIVIPAYNEEAALPAFVGDLADFLERQTQGGRFEFTVLIVDDGSADGTGTAIDALARAHAVKPIVVRKLSLLRNFGHQAALIAGMLEAAGSADFVITLDADGEHPFGNIADLIACWLAGESIVHTRRRPHRGLSPVKRVTSALYYWLLRWASGLRIAAGMADFKLWDGDLLREIRTVLPHCGSTRAFAVWLAPDAQVIDYDQNVVKGRVSRFTSRKMWSLALSGVVRYSDLPLRFSTMVGLAALSFAAVLAAFVIWAVATDRTVPGWASTMLAIASFGGLQSFAIGILGEYMLRNWFRQSLPTFVVSPRRRNFEAPAAVPQAGTSKLR